MARKRVKGPFHLFVYGTLINSNVFRAVTGLRLVYDRHSADGPDAVRARPAVLTGYTKQSPDNTYLYAVPDRQGRINGYVIGPLPPESMPALMDYEGRNYSRRRVRVDTKRGKTDAFAFVANLKQLRHHFGYEFRDHYKQEVLLQDKIERALKETEKEQVDTDEHLALRAVGELHGDIIRDLHRQHFDAGGISDYAIKQSLRDKPLPDFTRVTGDPEAMALAENYLSLVVRQVIFNQFEERIRRDFRYELDHMDHAADSYDRTPSSLLALRMLNNKSELLRMLVGDCLTDLSFQEDRLIDFVRWAILAADAIYDPALARMELEYIQRHGGGGAIPLGAELEFSNIGHEVIRDPEGQKLRDPDYDGFYYFNDFGLDVLTWKLGGHVDDHHTKVSNGPRRGFLELALGNLSVSANISKPVTKDPWILNQFIQQVRQFYDLGPHSVHMSMQLRSQHRPDRDRLLPFGTLQCLFALAGDPQQREDGSTFISRLSDNEIVSTGENPGILFSEISLRRSSEHDEIYPSVRSGRHGLYVQQFRFARLSASMNYELVALALKGVQINLRPGTFLTPEQHRTSARHRRMYDRLVRWGADAEPISERNIERFLKHVYDGLMVEKRGKPSHNEAYIAWTISQLRSSLLKFNNSVQKRFAPKTQTGSHPN
ncbi:MAG: gamma-glutamylcyclotransferase family protein [Phycisphaerae bacterium]